MAASVLMVAVAPVAACSAPAGPVVTAPATPSAAAPTSAEAASPSAQPTPRPTWPPVMALPTPPPEMSRDDEAGAVAAATYFMTDVYIYTVASHDTSKWRAMSHPLCVYCKSIAAGADAENDEGNATTPGAISVAAVRADVLNAATFGVKLDVHVGRAVKRSADGAVLGEAAAGDATMAVIVVKQGDHWLVRGVDVLPFGSDA